MSLTSSNIPTCPDGLRPVSTNGDGEPADLATLLMPPPLRHLAFSFTNRCNLRCIYCPQGTHPDSFYADTAERQIDLILEYIERHGIEKVSIGYYGETMLIQGWEKYCLPLLNKGIEIVFVSSFSRVMTPDEVAVVSRFTEVEISIDSVDIDILRAVRKAVDVRTILYNTHLIRTHVIAHALPMPRLVWTAVMTDWMVNGLPDLVAMAISSGIINVNVNDLAYFEGTRIDGSGHVADMPAETFPAAFAAIQHAFRLARRHGVRFTIAGLERLERRARAILGRAAYGLAVGVLQHIDDVDQERPIFVYGTGKAGRQLCQVLSAVHGVTPAGFIDSHQDGEQDGVPVLALATYREQAVPGDQILIATMYEDEVDTVLLQAGINTALRAHRVAMASVTDETYAADAIPTDRIAGAETTWRQGIQGPYMCTGDSADDVAPGFTRHCPSPWTEIYFDPKGEAYSCCFRGIVMATLSPETDIDTIRRSSAFHRLRHSLLTGQMLDPECSRCTGHRAVPVAAFQDYIRTLLSTCSVTDEEPR